MYPNDSFSSLYDKGLHPEGIYCNSSCPGEYIQTQLQFIFNYLYTAGFVEGWECFHVLYLLSNQKQILTTCIWTPPSSAIIDLMKCNTSSARIRIYYCPPELYTLKEITHFCTCSLCLDVSIMRQILFYFKTWFKPMIYLPLAFYMFCFKKY